MAAFISKLNIWLGGYIRGRMYFIVVVIGIDTCLIIDVIEEILLFI